MRDSTKGSRSGTARVYAVPWRGYGSWTPVTPCTESVTSVVTSCTVLVTLSTVGATSEDGRICVVVSIVCSGIVTVGSCGVVSSIWVRGVVVSGADGASGVDGAPGTAGADPPTASGTEPPESPEAAGALDSRRSAAPV